MSSRAVKGVCVFNSQWLTDDEFKLWIARSNCETEFRCIYCKVNLSLGNMGVKALRSHATRSKTHVSLARLRTETLQIEYQLNRLIQLNMPRSNLGGVLW